LEGKLTSSGIRLEGLLLVLWCLGSCGGGELALAAADEAHVDTAAGCGTERHNKRQHMRAGPGAWRAGGTGLCWLIDVRPGGGPRDVYDKDAVYVLVVVDCGELVARGRLLTSLRREIYLPELRTFFTGGERESVCACAAAKA